MATDLPPTFHLIDYAYENGGTFYHGTLSDLNSVPLSTWTLSSGSQKQSVNVPIDAKTFTELWQGLERLTVFRRFLIEDPATRLDFRHFQVISLTVSENGARRTESFLVPPDDQDAGYKRWKDQLRVPGSQY